MEQSINKSVGRVASFRTSLQHQKQKLMGQSQLQHNFAKIKIGSNLKDKKEGEPFGPMRKISRTRESANQEYSKDVPDLSAENISVQNVEHLQKSESNERTDPAAITVLCADVPSGDQDQEERRPPVPRDSPLLHKKSEDPIRKRIRSFNRSIRRAQSFRSNRDKEHNREEEIIPVNSQPDSFSEREVRFLVKRSLLGRSGWKVMPEDDNLDLKMNKDVLNQVLQRIRDMQYCGESVPDRISIRVRM